MIIPTLRTSLLSVVLPLGLVGCVTTTVLEAPAQLDTMHDTPNRLLVQLRGDSSWLPVIQHRTTPDSLFGKVEGSAAPGTPLRSLALPFDSVARIKIQRKDVGRAMAIPVVTGIVVAMTAWILVSP